MLIIQDVQCICQLGFIVFYVSDMFLVSLFQAAVQLSDV